MAEASRHTAVSSGVPDDSPETERVTRRRIACDGGGALGHPRVWLEIGEAGYVECGYCDKRYILEGGPADTGGHG